MCPPYSPTVVAAAGLSPGHALRRRGACRRSLHPAEPQTLGGEAADRRFVRRRRLSLASSILDPAPLHSVTDPPALVAEAGLSSLRQKGTVVLEQMCGQQQPWTLEEAESPVGEQQDNVQHVQAVMEEMQLRKQR